VTAPGGIFCELLCLFEELTPDLVGGDAIGEQLRLHRPQHRDMFRSEFAL
jgi:hypothetical protein